jgi:hypothetical protein
MCVVEVEVAPTAACPAAAAPSRSRPNGLKRGRSRIAWSVRRPTLYGNSARLPSAFGRESGPGRARRRTPHWPCSKTDSPCLPPRGADRAVGGFPTWAENSGRRASLLPTVLLSPGRVASRSRTLGAPPRQCPVARRSQPAAAVRAARSLRASGSGSLAVSAGEPLPNSVRGAAKTFALLRSPAGGADQRARRPTRGSLVQTISSAAPRDLCCFARDEQRLLGETLDAERLVASYETGGLIPRIPVAESAKPRKVKITESADGRTIEVQTTGRRIPPRRRRAPP